MKQPYDRHYCHYRCYCYHRYHRYYLGYLVAFLITACGGAAAPSAPAVDAPPAVDPARGDAVARVESSTAVIRVLRADLDGAIPLAIARSARCVAVAPGLVHAGLVLGARAGRGVVTCRDKGGFTKPAFFVLSGASAGASVGVEKVDLVMLFMTQASESALLDGRMQIGADTSIAAGPVGRNAQAESDVLLRAAIIYYSRTRGLFVGLDLSGTVIEQDEMASRAFYGDTRDFGALLRGDQPAPPSAAAFRAEIEQAFPGH